MFVCSVSPVSHESVVDSEQDLVADDSALSDHGIGDLIPSDDDASNDSVTEVPEEIRVDDAFFGNVYSPKTGGDAEGEDDKNDLDTVSITSCSSVSPGEAYNILSCLIYARIADVFNELPTLSQRASYAASHPNTWYPKELLSDHLGVY